MHPSFQSIEPPLKAFYSCGNLALLDRIKVAIVGSRRASQYAKDMSFKIAQAVSQAGGVVVSGAALGIDTFAHKGAFPDTIAVMANGLDRFVPRTNKGLIESMQNDALILSEYAPGTPPLKHHFVERNRIVVGISDAVILAEADLKSGTMRSAAFAEAMQKKIYVLPHRLGESLGTASLVQAKKAEVIQSIEDLLKRLGLQAKAEDQTDDPFLIYCQSHPTYEEAVARFSQELFEYELSGRIKIMQGRVYPSSS